MSGWRRLRERLSKSDFATSRVLVGLDFDGTLADLAETPGRAALTPRTRSLLEALTRRPDRAVAVISGRSLDDVRRLVRVPGVYLAGNHGLQIEGPDLRWTHPAATALDHSFRRALEADVSAIPGALVEYKRLGVSVHYRRVPRRHVGRLSQRVRARLSALRDGWRLMRGKKTFDIRPAVPWDKGHALEAVRRRLPGGWLGLFVGDDLTDEEGFATLGPTALTIRVGRAEKTAAQYVLCRRPQVDRLLELLAAPSAQA